MKKFILVCWLIRLERIRNKKGYRELVYKTLYLYSVRRDIEYKPDRRRSYEWEKPLPHPLDSLQSAFERTERFLDYSTGTEIKEVCLQSNGEGDE